MHPRSEVLHDIVCMHTIFTWLNAVAFITLVPEIDATTIQTRPLLDILKQCLSP